MRHFRFLHLFHLRSVRILPTLALCAVVFPMGSPLPLSAQTDGDLGVIEGRARSEFNITVRSSDPSLQRLAQSAFALHGAYEVRTGGTTHFDFSFDPNGRDGVDLVVRSAGQVLLEQTFRASDRNRALLLAADHAVQRTLDIPGFFAGTIAFISERTGASEVYVSDLFFLNARQLTRDRSQAILPNLSPDGRRLLYTSYHRNGFPDIYSIDLETNRRTTFASFRGTNTGATFSPDGREVAMVLSGSGNAEIFVSDAQGRNLRRLTHTPAVEADPTWSPDGRRLAFVSDSPGRPQLFTMSASGGPATRIPTDISRHCTEPAWNPRDADVIAFTAAIGREFEIALYSFRDRASRQISRGAGDAIEPAWLNDGRHLIFTRRTANGSHLMILDTKTGQSQRLSPPEFRNTYQANFVYVR